MTAQEAAAALGTSVAWVYRNKKALRAFQACPRGAVLIPDKVVQSILDGTYTLEQQASSEPAKLTQEASRAGRRGSHRAKAKPLEDPYGLMAPHDLLNPNRSLRKKKDRVPDDDPFGVGDGYKR